MNKKKLVYIIIAVCAAVLLACFGIFYAFSKNDNTEKSENKTSQTDNKKNFSQDKSDLTGDEDMKTNEKNFGAEPYGESGQEIKKVPDTKELGDLIEKFNTMEEGEEKEEVRKQLEDILSYAEEQAQKLK